MMKPIEISSLYELAFAGGAALSPNGHYAAYIVSRPNQKENGYDSNLFVVELSSKTSRQLTWDGKVTSFVWENDKHIIFPAERCEADKPEKYKKKTAFYRLPLDGGEAQPAFSVDMDVDSIRRAGDDLYLLSCTVDLNALSPNADEETKEDEKDYHVLEEVPFWANGKGYVSRLRSQLYLFAPEKGICEQITPDAFQVESFDLKNGLIAYAGEAYLEKCSLYGEAYLYSIQDKTTTPIIQHSDKLNVGRVILTDTDCVIGLTDMQPWGAGQYHDLYRYNLTSHELALAKKLDFLNGPDVLFDCQYTSGDTMASIGDDLFFIGQNGHHMKLWKLDASNALTEAVQFDGCVFSLSAAQGAIVFTGAPANGMLNLYAIENGAAAPITDINGAFLQNHYVAQAEYCGFTNSDGVSIDGWVLKPEGYDPGKKYPAILEIHGGPRCTFSDIFYHEMQAFVGAGYLVFFCNPRGSEGYGEAFADLRGKYGTIDYQDLMEFTDHILKAYPSIDPARVGACGGSYGGFMCNWIEGHTDRFAAIASQRSISNWVADFGSSEIGFTFDNNEMGATPWTDMEAMWEQSPLKYAHQAKTPILFIHSLQDYNCTVDQGVEMFAAMKYFSVPSRMVLFEGENHSLSRSGKPRHRVRRLKEMLSWFDKYLKHDN